MLSFDEPLLEPVARFVRFGRALPYLRKNKPLSVVDLGCGPQLRFLKFARHHHVTVKQYYGVDPLIPAAIKQSLENKQVEIVNQPLIKKIALPSNSVDYVVGFAFLEHVDHPQALLNDAIRILKPGGTLVFTTPTPLAKTILEFLSFKLGLISLREIEEHKQYFTKDNLIGLIDEPRKLKKIEHHYFELGLNNILVITK